MTEGRASWRSMRNRAAGADEILRAFRIVRPAVDVEGIVTALGVELIHDRNMGPVVGAVRGTADGAEMRVNTAFPVEMQRWTIAHELGHLMKHRLGESYLSVLGKLDAADRIEREADAFASELLMPRYFVVGYARSGVTVDALADLMKVPVDRMSDRVLEIYGPSFRRA